MAKLSPLEASERRLGMIMLAPAAILLVVTVLYPIASLIRGSFGQNVLTEPWMADPWIGFANYAKALADSRFWESTWNTVLYVLITVPGAVLVGLGLALLANQPFRVKWPVRLGLLVPWALPLVFAGLIFRWFFDYQQGLVNNALIWIGLSPVNWLTRETPAFFAICVAIIWKTSSFAALVLLAGLQTIPKSLYEAAEVDGATKWRQFVEITLPMLMPAIFVALIFRTITAIQTFDIPKAMTDGGPGKSNETLAMYIHTTTIDALDFGYGSTLAVIMFIFSAALTSIYLRYTRRDPSAGRA
jgi:multiple sugar transport system permease protein